MTAVSIHEAKAHFSTLVAGVERDGRAVVICRYGRAVARLSPMPSGKRTKVNPHLRSVVIHGDPTATTEQEWEHA